MLRRHRTHPARLAGVVLAASLMAAGPLPALDATSAGTTAPGVEVIASLPEMQAAIAVGFIDEAMYVSTATGLYAYDISDPANPAMTSAFPHYIWENEDMDVDTERKLVFVSRDPRGFTTPAAPAQARLFGAVEIFDVSNPAVIAPVGGFVVPAGHTSTCVSAGEGECDFLWTGGPYANENFGPSARPIYATDIRDIQNPVECPEPINMGLFDGATGYAHDVQVDDMGVAWVSSEGGVHGWWTHGEHIDPLTGESREATPCDPVAYGGGGSPEESTPSRFMHNSARPSQIAIPGDDESKGMILLATEEDTSTACATSGRFATYDLRSSLTGEGFRDPAGFRMDPLDTWTPEGAEGATGCASAHYFTDRGDGLLAYAFYGQGVRFLDVSDPRDIRQVGWYRQDDSNAWAAYWHTIGDQEVVVVPDFTRGVEILRFTPQGAPSSLPASEAPALAAGSLAVPVLMDEQWAYLCPLPLGA